MQGKTSKGCLAARQLSANQAQGVACNTQIETGSLALVRQSVALGRSPSASAAMDGR